MLKKEEVKKVTWRQLVDGEVKELEKYFPETMWYYEVGEEDWSSHFFKKERREILKQLVF